MADKTVLSAAEFRAMYVNTPQTITHDQDNKKIKSAKKVVWNGIKFDSKLELYFYKALIRLNIPFTFKKKFVIVPGFRYRGKKIRDITWTADFIFEQLNVIVDTKGWANDTFPVRLKLFKKYIIDNGLPEYEIMIPSSHKQCDQVVMKLLKLKNDVKINGRPRISQKTFKCEN